MEQIDTIRTCADFTLRVGEFVQRIAGYEELSDLLPRQECYCADKY